MALNGNLSDLTTCLYNCIMLGTTGKTWGCSRGFDNLRVVDYTVVCHIGDGREKVEVFRTESRVH